MKNSEQPITPCIMQQVADNEYRLHKEGDAREHRIPMIGLTKREYFAAKAMGSLLIKFPEKSSEWISREALSIVDELLKQLEK